MKTYNNFKAFIGFTVQYLNRTVNSTSNSLIIQQLVNKDLHNVLKKSDMAQFLLFDVTVMDIEKINRKHYLGLDMYYRVGYGLSSKLIKFENGVIHLEVVLGRKWKKNYNATAAELAHAWKNSHRELSKALACKVFVADCKLHPYKQFLIHNGIAPDYDAKKGIIFAKYYLN